MFFRKPKQTFLSTKFLCDSSCGVCIDCNEKIINRNHARLHLETYQKHRIISLPASSEGAYITITTLEKVR